MRLALKIIISILIAITLVCAFVYKNPHIMNSIARTIIESAMSNKVLKVKLGDISLSKDLILIHNVSFSEHGAQIGGIESVEVTYDLGQTLRKRKLLCELKINHFTMDAINFDATGEVVYSSSEKTVKNFQMNFAGGGSVKVDSDYKKSFGSARSLSISSNINNLPLMLHKAFWSIAPDNDVVIFLKDYISGGFISGNLKVDLDEEFFDKGTVKPDAISGQFALKEVALRYDVEYPVLQKLNADVALSGTKLNFEITHGYSGKVALYDGKVELDWGKEGYSEVIISTKGHGPVLDLVEFIPRDTVEELKKNQIDLTKATGQMNIDFAMTVPLDPALPNTYDVKADINGMGLKIFNDNVILEGAVLKGGFNGKTVSIAGKGKVNGFESDLSYLLNLENADSMENDLDIKLKFTPANTSTNHNFSVLKGKSVVDLNYKSRGNKGSFAASANLTDLEFLIEKLGIHKYQGDKASLEITSAGDGLMPSDLNIKLLGADNLKILGTAKITKDSQIINIPKIQHFDTDIKAQLTLAEHSLKAVVSGSTLDLSQADMLNFLEKDAQSRSTDLQVNVSRIKMRNNIWLNDFVLTLRCDKAKCYAGEMDSKINGTQSFNMHLGNQGNTEQWEISTTNAGLLFNALGLYDKMKDGSLMLIINTSRKEVKAGHPVPVVDGHFVLKKFVTTNTPILARMVSFISLPGMMSTITNNKDIRFSEMVGDFNYKDYVVNISNAAAEGLFFDFTMSGWVDTTKRTVKLKGNVTPSLYGISTIVRKIPIVGKIFGGGKSRKGIISPPYTINTKY